MKRKTTEAQQELAKELFIKGKKYQEIADEVGVSLSAVKSWASRYWKKEKLQPVKNKSCNQKNGKVKKKRAPGAPKGNHNATGPPGNQNARKHGLFAKYVQDDVKEIMEDLQQSHMSQLDILMDSIEFMYAKIIKAQQVMCVEDKNDTSKEISMHGEDVTGYAVQYAWDKQHNEIKALSRAFAELRSLMKAYDELSKSEKATEEQQARIDLLQFQISKLKSENLSENDKNKVVIVNDLNQFQ